MERGKEDNMWPYFLLIFIIFLLQFKYGNGGKSKIRFYVGLIILFLFAALTYFLLTVPDDSDKLLKVQETKFL